MTIQIIQRAKFALLYQNVHAVAHHDDGEPYVVDERAEEPVVGAAVVLINGLRLTSAIPTSAAEAAKINEELGRLEEDSSPVAHATD